MAGQRTAPSLFHNTIYMERHAQGWALSAIFQVKEVQIKNQLWRTVNKMVTQVGEEYLIGHSGDPGLGRVSVPSSHNSAIIKGSRKVANTARQPSQTVNQRHRGFPGSWGSRMHDILKYLRLWYF